MPLSNGTADTCAAAICAALGVSDQATLDKYKQVYEILYAQLKAQILITLPAASVVTSGSASTQTGPAAPVPMTPA